jgi:hypothetical protein
LDNTKLYQQRQDRILAAANLEKPDRIPIISMAQNFSVGYGGSTLSACLADEQEEYRAFDKTYTDFTWDGTVRYGLIRNMRFYEILGFNTFFESDSGTCLQHRDKCFMEITDYPEFIKDPVKYIINTDFIRKYPGLNKPYPENKKILMEAVSSSMAYQQRVQRRTAHVKNDLALPMIENGIFLAPGFDLLFSYLRGFSGITDIRRKPEQVLAASEAMMEIQTWPLFPRSNTPGVYFAFAPALFTAQLSRNQFERFIWPDYKKLITEHYKFGRKTFLMMEGKWSHVYDMLNDLPKGSVVAHVDKDNIFEAKKAIGKNCCIAGGIDIYDLKYSSKQTCIDKVRKVIDECAADGGFIFTQNQILIDVADINPENLKSVNEFVYQYGVYQ